MGFNILLYGKDNTIVEFYELNQSLHNEIFNSNKIWRSYQELRKMSEYYRTDEEYIGSSLIDLIEDLKKYKMFISKNKQVEYQEFIDKISNPQIFKISVGSD
ncbi:hypothetical protein [Gottfriedia acidiceleris]|uniref:hypothetical protein n=1 Tax=Gottfriedia acidiceleris TaxID=371036 RepID=UPI002FFFBF6D